MGRDHRHQFIERLSRHALSPAMQQANSGKGWDSVINIALAHGLDASAEKSTYVASKHAVVGLTKVIALVNAKSGVTSKASCSSWVLTPLVQKQLEDRAKAGNNVRGVAWNMDGS